MNYDLQKASPLKRASAWLLDVILLVCLATGFAAALSGLSGYDRYSDQLSTAYEKYEQQYGIDFDISAEDYAALPQQQREQYDAAAAALNQDREAQKAYAMTVNLVLMFTSFGILLSYLILELLIPLWLKNGQTVGKKVFGIALMRTDGVRVTPFMMFVRTVFGKYTLETMVPVLMVLMLMFGIIGIVGPIVIGLILLLQVVLLIATRTNSAIHDLVACTVAVDLASQMIFDSPEARLEYQKRIQAEEAAKADY